MLWSAIRSAPKPGVSLFSGTDTDTILPASSSSSAHMVVLMVTLPALLASAPAPDMVQAAIDEGRKSLEENA